MAIGDIVRNGKIRLVAVNTSNTDFELDEDEYVGKLNVIGEETHLVPVNAEEPPHTEIDSSPAAAAAAQTPFDQVNLENSNIDSTQINELKEVIDSFQDIFSKSISDLGRTNAVQHVI